MSTDLERFDRRTGIEKLRILVRVYDHCRESFNQRFTPEQLLKLYRCAIASEWDFTPDTWDERQVQGALTTGRIPRWHDDESANLSPDGGAFCPEPDT